MIRPFFYAIAIAAVLSVALFAGCTQPEAAQERDTLYQVSTFNALSQGVYDGSETFGTLKAHGDAGLGTLEALDGELIGLDGQYYQAKADGTVVPVGDSATTPFAIATFFDEDRTVRVANLSSLAEYMASLNESMTNRNVMYAFKAQGHFDHVRARSVPAQPKPYPVLTEAVKGQAVFDYYDVNGTILGFWFPEYMSGVNVAGFHFHFISDDRQRGGHLLDCSADGLTTAIDETDRFYLALPPGDDFGRAEIGKTNETAVGVIER
ncbi:MAG: Alpha-acetolactate decarboxylase [Methanocella sp. PtaU1.Bin125]|nr:MAG: Alpha-acetolactate decarboxylase [Methanocella sp. PtaU1.Bin125]